MRLIKDKIKMKRFKYDKTFLEYINMIDSDAKFAKWFFGFFYTLFSGLSFYTAYVSYENDMDLTILTFCVSGIYTWLVLGLIHAKFCSLDSKIESIIEKIEMMDAENETK